MMKILKILSLLFAFSISSYGNSTEINIDSLSKQAVKEKKHILIFFHMKYCPYCEKMVDESFEDKKVKQTLKKDFIVVDINTNDNENIIYQEFKGDKSKFAKEMDISFYPTVLFLDEENEVAYTLRGYRDKKKFKKVLRFIKSKSYEDMDFTEFTD
ncbi:MAG: thioredoxin fold domain-containing protein [Campylobacterota bacterium]|nr:thioredoxin fold domain-containing protein [Campylobacterota bacterium]